MVKKLVLVMAAAAAAGCASGAAEPTGIENAATVVSVGDTVQLRFGEAVTIAQSGVRVQFRNVVADSRCPIDAVCVWAGDAHVQIAAGDATATRTYDLHSFLEPRAVQHDAYRFQLVEVGPSRRSTETPRESQYYVKLVITRTN